MPRIERVAIMGVTGFVGHGLPGIFAGKSIAVTGISRSSGHRIPGVDRWQTPDQLDFSGHSAVINLAGEPLDRRWTAKSKRLFHESRVGVTSAIVAAIAKLPENERPEVLVNASAIGIYGDRGDEILREDAHPGTDYLAELCSDWEDAARDAESLGVRVVRLRIGVVLGKGGAAFEKLRTVFQSFIGGKLGSGEQWMPWIHIDDLRAAIVHAVLSESLSGAVNVTAPYPERNRDLTRKFASAFHRPAIFSSPAFILRLMLGEFSSALLSSYRVIPAALDAEGFQFRYPTLETALVDLV